jgi:hypothetical protein
VLYLVENNVITGDAAVEAVGWAEERREELEAALGKKQLAEMWGRGSGACGGASSSGTAARASERMMTSVADLAVLARELLLLLKIALAMMFFLVVGCVVLIVRK